MEPYTLSDLLYQDVGALMYFINYSGKRHIVLTHIKRFTKKGRIVTDHGTWYPDGRPVGTTNLWNTRSDLKPVTDEVIEQVKRQRALRKIELVTWSKVPQDTLSDILDILENNIGE